MPMEYHIDPSLSIPIYQQLVDHIRSAIKQGDLAAGEQLPTVQEMAARLAIARGTIKRAYDELERAGLVEKTQGSGTFVRYQPAESGSRMEQAMAHIDGLLDRLESMGLSMSEISIFVSLKLRERAEKAPNLKVAIVECNMENLSQLSEQLRQIEGIELFSYLLQTVEAYPYKLGEEMDLIVTTMTHADEVEQLVSAAKKIARVALQLQPRCVGRIVKLPDDYVVGILSGSLRYGDLLRQTCSSYADSTTILEPQLLGDPKGCQTLLDQADAILLPEGYEKYCSQADLEQLNRFEQDHPLLLCAYQIDEGSFMYLEDKIQRLQAKQRI